MTDHIRLNLSKAAAVIGVVGGAAGIVATAVLMPYRMNAAEERIKNLETQVSESRELLVRIDENVKALKERAAKTQ